MRASACEHVHGWFRVFHGYVPMWNRFVEPRFSAYHCGLAPDGVARGSVVPRRTKLIYKADRGPWLFVISSTDLKLVEPVEPDLETLTGTASIVFHDSWNQVEPVEPKIPRESLRFVALQVGGVSLM